MELGWLACFAGAFLVGSIPTGYLLARARGIDIRQHGSRNIGATNVMRVLGRRTGIACFVLDVLKGLVPVLGAGVVMGLVGAGESVPRTLSDAQGLWWMGVVGAAVAGHMYTPWLGFRGGKGVATGVGALLGVAPFMTLPAVVALVVFAATLGLWRYVSLSSCAAALSIPLGAWAIPAALAGAGLAETAARVRAPLSMIGAAAVLAGVVIVKHRANFRRLLAGTEYRIGQRVEAAGQRPLASEQPPPVS